MSLFALKIIAIVSMTIDHIGRFFFPEAEWMTIIGRLAFPIFAWGIANGYRHTKDIKKYAFRLFFFALISQVPYSFGFIQIGRSPYELNILFTLLFGLYAIIAREKIHNTYLRVCTLTVMFFLGEMLHMSYGWYGVALVLLFHVTYKNAASRFLFFTIATFGYVFVNTCAATILQEGGVVYQGLSQVYALCALIPIAYYTGQPGKHLRYFFYLYYTLHLALFAIIRYYLR